MKGSIDMNGIGAKVNWDELFSLPKDYWCEDMEETRKFLDEQVGCDLPAALARQLDEQQERVLSM